MDGGVIDDSISKLLKKHCKTGKYVATSKYLIIGKSGSGKTQLAFRLAYFVIKKYSNIIYISSQFDDDIIEYFEKITTKAGMPFYEITVDPNGGINVPDVKNSLVIIDDQYTSTGRPKGLELYLMQLVNRGRHEGNHVIYIAQGVDYLPKEILKNNTGVFVDKYYEKFPVSINIKKKIKHQWYIITEDALHDDANIERVQFPNKEISEKDAIKHMKEKILPEDKGKKVPDKQDYISMGKQGNKYATKVGKKMDDIPKKGEGYDLSRIFGN